MKRQALTGLAALTLFDIATAHAKTPVNNPWAGTMSAATPAIEGPMSTVGPYAGLLIYDAFLNRAFRSTQCRFRSNRRTGCWDPRRIQHHAEPPLARGVEADASFGRGSETTTLSQTDPINLTSGAASFSASVDWSATFRGRVGYIFGPMLFSRRAASRSRRSRSRPSALSPAGILRLPRLFTWIYSNSSTSASRRRRLSSVAYRRRRRAGAGTEPDAAKEYLFAYYGNVNFGNAIINSTYSDNFICVCTINSTASGPVSASLSTQTVRIGLSYRLP